MTTEPSAGEQDDTPRLSTDFAKALADLTTSVLGSTETGPLFDAVLATVEWLRAPQNQKKARILIGDLTHGY